MLDGGASETAAVADINRDGRLDIVSGENWYEGPGVDAAPFRELNFTNNYVDDFSDLPVDVERRRLSRRRVGHVVREEDRLVEESGQGAAGRGPRRRSTPASRSSSRCSSTSTTTARPQEVLPQAGSTQTPLAWYEAKAGSWIKHVVSAAELRPRHRRG